MPALGGNVLTLADWAKRIDPQGKTPMIAELLTQQNDILNDMLFKEGNLPTGERTTVRTGLPSVYWRNINAGVQPSKSTTAQVDEACGMLEAYSEVDKDLAELNGNTNEFRLSEAQAFIEAMNQEAASTIIYGNSSTAPEEFNGLSIRYSDTSASNGQNIVSGGGSGADQTSIWLVGWGANTCHGIFPKGSKAGLMHEDLGLVTVETTAGIAGNRMRAYQDHWQWKLGVALRDWRYAVRIANIDVGALTTNTTPPDIPELMIKAIHRIPNLNACKPVFYMNRTAFQFLDLQRRDDYITGGGLDYAMVDGKAMYSFRGIPVRIVDSILDTEAVVS